MGGPPRYTPAQLRDAVATSRNIREVCLKLGLAGYGANYRTIRRAIAREGVDTSHFAIGTRPNVVMQQRLLDAHPRLRSGRVANFTMGELEYAVASSTSFAGVARCLGVDTPGAAYGYVRRLIEEHRLDTSHFLGQAWSRDRTGLRTGTETPLSELLVRGRPYSSSRLKERLIIEGIKEKHCERCLGTRWQDRDMPLELDHINGDPDDNRLENLRLVCPNCHALTENYREKNIGRR